MPTDPLDALVTDLRRAGFALKLAEPDVLLVSPDGSPLPMTSWLPAELGKRLRAHKRELRDRLRAEAAK